MHITQAAYEAAPIETMEGGPKPDGTRHILRYRILNGTAYHAETPLACVNALERAREGDWRIRLWLGDTHGERAGEIWMSKWHVTGTLGRSCGRIKIPILLANARSMGGGGVLDHCIVRITLSGPPHTELYRHPQFRFPNLALVEDTLQTKHGTYLFKVSRDGEEQARFKTRHSAERYVKFFTTPKIAA